MISPSIISRPALALRPYFAAAAMATPAANAANAATRSVCTQLSAASKCVGCEGLTDPMPPADVERYLDTLLPNWSADDARTRISRSFRVPDFNAAMAFLNRVADLADAENHHPDVAIRRFNRVTIDLWTHAVNGLTENDIIMAAKIDTIPVPTKPNKQ